MKHLIGSNKRSILIILFLSLVWIYSSLKAGSEIWNNSDYMSHEFGDMDPGLGALLGTSAIIIIPFCVIGIILLLFFYLLFTLIIKSSKSPIVISVFCFLISILFGIYEINDTIYDSMNYYLWELYWSIIAEIIYSLMVVISIINLGRILRDRFKNKSKVSQ